MERLLSSSGVVALRAAALGLVVAVLGVDGAALAGQVQTGHRDRLARIEESITSRDDPATPHSIPARLGFYDVPGVSVAVLDAGVIVWARTWGVRRAGGGEPLTPQTLFQAASISKPVAALAAMELVERGVLDLDRPVNEYLRSWKLPENELTGREPVTLRRILSHTAGLTQHGFPGYEVAAPLPGLADILDGTGAANTGAVRVDPLPGTIWRYSGGGYTILQAVLEDVTGQPFPELMRELVLRPAGLMVSTYEQPLPLDVWQTAAHAHDSEGVPIEGDWHVYPEMAAAGLWTTPFELLRIVQDLQEAYAGSVARLLEPATVREMLRPVMNGYGLGFSTAEGPGARFGHGGSNAGFKASLLALVEGGKGVAVMTNGDRGAQLAEEIVRAVALEYGWPEPPGG